MLTPRNFILLTVSLAIISIVWVCFAVTQTPDGDGLRADSYGTRYHGHRGIVEVLSELGHPVRRLSTPPNAGLPGRSTLVLWDPKSDLVRGEQKWLRQLREWLYAGGRVVVAMEAAPPEDDEEAGPRTLTGDPLQGLPDLDVLELLNVTAATVVPAWRPADDEAELATQISDGVVTSERGDPSLAEKSKRQTFDEALDEFVEAIQTIEEQMELPVRGTGRFAGVTGLRGSISLPDRPFSAVSGIDPESADAILVSDPNGKEHAIAAAIPVGDGEVVVVTVPRLISNRNLGAADNVIVAAALLIGDGREIVFDEFYHGLAMRGNVFWLFAQPGYGVVTIVLLTAVAVMIWRHSVFLGPPLTERRPPRRSISEYIEAVSRFLREARGHQSFIVEQVRDGILWKLRHEHGLPAEGEHTEALISAMARRNPRRAATLRESLNDLNELLSAGKAGDEKRSSLLLQRMTDCLSKNATALSAMKSAK